MDFVGKNIDGITFGPMLRCDLCWGDAWGFRLLRFVLQLVRSMGMTCMGEAQPA